MSGLGRFVLLVVVSVLGIATAILWRDNREMARRIRILEGAERITNMRMLEIQEERLRLERLQYFLPMEWTPPPGGIAMCQDGTEAIKSTI